MKEFDKRIKSKTNILKAVGIIEILGGVSGLNILYSLVFSGIEITPLVLVVFAFVIVFYGFSIFAGLRLFMKSEILYSQIIQYLQVFAISFGGMTYFLTLGGFLMVGYNLTLSNLGFNINFFSSTFQIDIISSNQESYVYLNLMAIILLNLIERSKKVIELENEKKDNYLNRFYE